MSPPSPNRQFNLGGIEVTPSGLREQASTWDEESAAIGDIASGADRNRYLDNPGIFRQVITPYNQACDFISGLCHTGQSEMSKIAEALRVSADVYIETEQQITDQIRRIGL